MTLHERLLDNLRTALAVVREDGEVVYANDLFREVFGSEGEQWLTAAARTIGGERGWLQAFFARGGDSYAMDVEFQGRTYRVDQLLFEAGDEPSVGLLFEDVTRQREAEQAKSDFTSMIVHDLRGPLSGIQGTLEFILGSDASRFDPVHAELLGEASREAERMMGLINELLDFSKIESGNFEVESDVVDMAGILRRSVRSLQSVASRENIHLVTAHGSDLPPITGSAEKLTQAVINLVSNSVKFTPKGGVIAVGARVMVDDEGDEQVVVTVTDTGVGMKPEDLPKIFEKYKQSKSKSLRGGGGTGLGLYIVRQIIEAHGGEIEVASSYGKGTSMVLRLPVRRSVA